VHPTYQRKAIWRLGTGAALLGGGLALLLLDFGPRWLGLVLLVSGLPVYLWGCAALAAARGHATALALTPLMALPLTSLTGPLVAMLLGLSFPIIILLNLPDRSAHYRERRRK
jgi:hypothetical protein